MSGLGWEAESESGSVRCGVAGEVAVVLSGDASGDGEAEAVTGFAWVESDEAFEDPLLLVFGDAGSIVCDHRLNIPVGLLHSDVDSAGGLDGGDGVVKEVAEHT
jgi:hypothetical protein